VDPYSDLAISTVQAGSTIIGSTGAAKTIILASGDGAVFPGGDGTTQFDVTLWPSGYPQSTTAEICRVTRTGDTLTTVTAGRGRAPTAAMSTVAAGWNVIAPLKSTHIDQLLTLSPATSARNQIQSTGTADVVGFNNNINVPGTTGTFTLLAGSTPVRVDRYGNLHGGMNYCLAPYPRNNTQQSVADFLYDQTMLRFCTRSIMLTQIGDPADFSGTRFGPEGGAPYAKPGGAIGAYTDLTGLGSVVAVAQFRGCPAAVPYNGSPTTPGGVAEVTAGTLYFRTNEMPRYLTPATVDKNLDLAVGMDLVVVTTPNGMDGRQPILNAAFTAAGNFQLGHWAIYNTPDTGARIQVRNELGSNCQYGLIGKAGTTISGGTFTLTHYGVPPTGPAFVGAGQTTANINYNATAQQVASALEALSTIGVGTTLGGTVTPSGSTLTGVGTTFLTDLVVNDFVTLSGSSADYQVTAVTSDTAISVSPNPSPTTSGQTIVRRNVAGQGGPLPGTLVALTFCGLRRNTHYVRPLASSNNLVGGGWIVVGKPGTPYANTTGGYGFAAGGDKLIASFQHGGRVAPTASYYKWIDPFGTTVQELDSQGRLIGNTATQAPGTNTTQLASTAFVTAAVAAGGGAFTTRSSKATSDTASIAANTYTDLTDSGGVGGAVAVSLTAGTWFVWGMVCLTDSSATGGSFQARITDGTNHYASGTAYRRPNAGESGTITMCGVCVVGSTTTVKLQATGTIGTTTTAKMALPSNPAGNTATQLTAIKVA
jgi:hypothetical protein